MIALASDLRVWLRGGATDLRRGMYGLSLQVQEGLGGDPFAGELFAFRGRCGDLIKVLWHDEVGLSLRAKRPERGRFIWPSPTDGAVAISAAQACAICWKASTGATRARRGARSGRDDRGRLTQQRPDPGDTTVPVLAKLKTDKDRARVYVRDDRPSAGPAPPAAVFHYSRNRRGEHARTASRWVVEHPAGRRLQRLQRALRGDRAPGPIHQALCWAHGRRGFFALADIACGAKRGKGVAAISPLALEAVRRIDVLFDIECDINGHNAETPHSASHTEAYDER